MADIRPETVEDAKSVRSVELLAFGRTSEAELVDRLRERGAAVHSLVAVEADEVVGHILFSPVRLEYVEDSFDGLGLAPLAVLPSHQNRGIGSLLARGGLEILRKSGHAYVAVLGHPGFYSRFGFVPAGRYGIGCEYDVPEESFMILELYKNALAGRRGEVRYRPEFREV